MDIIKILFSKTDRALLGYFVKKDLVAAYKGSVMGTLWNFLYPFLVMMIYAFVFGFLFGGRRSSGTIGSYVLVVASGFLFWQVFSSNVSSGANTFISNSSYLKKNKFNKKILFLQIVVTGFINLLIQFLVFGIMYLVIKRSFTIKFLYLFPVMFVFSLFSYYLIHLLASITPFFKDFRQIISLVLRLAMYLNCVLYTIDNIPHEFHKWYLLGNPVASFIELSRFIIFGSSYNYLSFYLISIFCWLVVFLILGNLAYAAIEKDVVDVL